MRDSMLSCDRTEFIDQAVIGDHRGVLDHHGGAITLLGHSFGGGDARRVAAERDVESDAVVGADPVRGDRVREKIGPTPCGRVGKWVWVDRWLWITRTSVFQ